MSGVKKFEDFNNVNEAKHLTIDGLAKRFIRNIEWYLDDKDMDKLRRESEGYENSNTCVSHNYCDANQMMINALRMFDVELDLQDDTQSRVINKAWSVAKKANFYEGPSIT